MDGAQRAAADDGDRIARADADDLLRVDGAAERFADGGGNIRNIVRHPDQMPGGPHGDLDIIGESAVIRRAHTNGVLAQIAQPVPAVIALAAGDRRRHRDAVANLERALALANMDNPACEFVTKDPRRLDLGVPHPPDLQIRTADQAA